MDAELFRKLVEELGCCLLGICCPPGSPPQEVAFTKLAVHHGITASDASAMFKAIMLPR